MLRLLTIFLSIALLGNAGAAVSGLYTYTVNADNASVTITDYPTTETGALVIVDTLGGYPVTSIGNGAFQSCSSLTSVNIPNSVTSIADFAFYNCSSLTSVTIPDSVTSIGDYAFRSCTGLTSITIPDSVSSIEAGAFESCTSLTSVVIPDSVSSIGGLGGRVFYNCSSLTSVTIPNGVSIIWQDTFRSCSSLTSVVIPDSVSIILDGAFYGCTNLASIGLESMAAPQIEPSAFDQISSAAIIQYPQGATGYAAFYDGVPTKEATPESPVLEIGDFYESSAGVSVVVSAIPTAGYPTNYTYQWYSNNLAIPANFGGTADSYTIDGIPSNEGTWRVVVTNDVGSTEASFEYRVFADSDSDGLSNYRESNITNTNPELADTDSDGLNDFVEVNTTLTDPNDSDSDDDTLLDGAEVNTYGSDPNDTDSDDDGLLDGIEVRHATFGFDPAVDSSARLAELIALVEEFPGVSKDAQNDSLSLGEVSLTPSGDNSLSVDFIIEESEDLSSWTTVDTVSHSLDTSDTKKFIRVRKP